MPDIVKNTDIGMQLLYCLFLSCLLFRQHCELGTCFCRKRRQMGDGVIQVLPRLMTSHKKPRLFPYQNQYFKQMQWKIWYSHGKHMPLHMLVWQVPYEVQIPPYLSAWNLEFTWKMPSCNELYATHICGDSKTERIYISQWSLTALMNARSIRGIEARFSPRFSVFLALITR